MADTLKVIHLNFADKNGGGAAKACWRIHKSLQNEGVNSKIAVWSSELDDKDFIVFASKRFKKLSFLKFRLYNFVAQKIMGLMNDNNQSHHSINRFGLIKAENINNLDADILHFHWFNAELLKIEEIKKIKKPIVFHLHDLWLLLGAEHYPKNAQDNRYLSDYSRKSRSKNESGYDINRYAYKRKKKHLQAIAGNIIATTNWLKSYAEESKLFSKKEITVIPCPVDTQIFKATDKKIARESLKLDPNAKIILFGAIMATTDKRKGYHILKDAMVKINQNAENTQIIVFGSDEPLNPPDYGFNTQYVGSINDDSLLAKYYSAADVFVNPTLMEAFGQTTLESISCGTPVIAFNYSGTKDIIDHKLNGYLATPFDPLDLAAGIDYCLQPENQESMKESCLEKAKQFTSDKVGKALVKYYQKILG